VSSQGYIYAIDWWKYQHYKNQTNPSWIKMYVRPIDTDEYRGLTLADRGLLHDVWRLIARVGQGKLSVTVDGAEAPFAFTRESIDSQLRSVEVPLRFTSRSLQSLLGVRRVSLEPLIHAGFLAIDSRKGLEELYSESRAEQSREAEEEYKKQGAPDTSSLLDGSAVMEEDRHQALQRLVASVPGDKGTAYQLTTRVVGLGSTSHEIERAREAALGDGVKNRAGMAMDVLAKLAAEREGASAA